MRFPAYLLMLVLCGSCHLLEAEIIAEIIAGISWCFA